MPNPHPELSPENVVEALRAHARVGLCFVDPDLHYVWVNDALADLVGYEPDELLGRTIADITHPDDIELDQRLSERAFRGEIPHFTTRKRYVHKNGSLITADLMASALHDDAGQPIGGFATVIPAGV